MDKSTDECVKHLAAMKNLKVVKFYCTSVTTTAIKKLKAERRGPYVTDARGREAK